MTGRRLHNDQPDGRRRTSSAARCRSRRRHSCRRRCSGSRASSSCGWPGRYQCRGQRILCRPRRPCIPCRICAQLRRQRRPSLQPRKYVCDDDGDASPDAAGAPPDAPDRPCQCGGHRWSHRGRPSPYQYARRCPSPYQHARRFPSFCQFARHFHCRPSARRRRPYTYGSAATAPTGNGGECSRDGEESGQDVVLAAERAACTGSSWL